MRRMWWFLAGLGACLVQCGATPAGAAAPWASDPIYVYYPRGDCRGEKLELEVWDREARDWRRHPGHPQVPLETCQVEDAGNLFNEIRSRCVEPPDTQPAASWVVGLDVFDPEVMESCSVDQRAVPTGDFQLHVASPAPGERVVAPQLLVDIEGSVRMDGIPGSDYDVLLVIDRSSGTRQGEPDLLAAQVQAARALVFRLAPRLGPVRIGISSYPNMPPMPSPSGSLGSTGARRVVALTDDLAALDRALDAVLRKGVSGFQTFGSAFDFALSELLGRHPGAGARPRARKLLVMAARSEARPFGRDQAYDPRFRARLGERLQGARDAHVGLHLFAMGGLAEELAPGVRELFERAEARFHRILRPALATAFFSHVSLPRVIRVVVANRTAGGGVTPASVAPNGDFATTVVAAAGRNRLWARATLSDGATTEREWAFEFDDSLVRARLLAAEREHMRRIRQKRLSLRPLWDEVLPPLPNEMPREATPDVAAPPRSR